MAVNFPNNPTLNQSFTVGTITWRWNGYAWNRIPDPGAKGEIGTKGDKGEVGLTGATGDKGQKGDVLQKGNKGEIGDKGATGAQGTQGPTGPQGTQGSSGTQGPAGPIGPQGPQGSSGTQGPTGPQGAQGPPGPPGSNATLPTGTIVAYGGNSAPTGWQLCNGGTASSSALQTVLGQSNVPDLRDRFIIGAGNSYSRHNTGGSKDSTLVSHSHTINNHTHSFSASATTSTKSLTGDITKISECYNVAGGAQGVFTKKNTSNSPVTGSASNSPTAGVDFDASHNHTVSVSGNTGNPSNTGTNNQGSSANNANLPPYYALIFIIKT